MNSKRGLRKARNLYLEGRTLGDCPCACRYDHRGHTLGKDRGPQLVNERNVVREELIYPGDRTLDVVNVGEAFPGLGKNLGQSLAALVWEVLDHNEHVTHLGVDGHELLARGDRLPV